MSSETSGLALGCHLSTAKGFEAMGRCALEIGATTFAFFTVLDVMTRCAGTNSIS